MEEKLIDFGHSFNRNKFGRTQRGDLYRRLEEIEDYRKPQGKQYKYADLLFIIVAASLFGYCDEFMIVEWCIINISLIMAVTTLRAIPSYKTIERVFINLNNEDLSGRLNEWLKEHFDCTAELDDHGHIQVKMDGKAHNAVALKSYGEKSRYVLGSQTQGCAIDLGILSIDDKSNECGSMPDFINKKLQLGPKTLLTADAAAATKAVLALVEHYHSKFLVPLKKNQENLYWAVFDEVLRLEALKDDEGISAFEKLPTTTHAPKKCHGRKEVRVCRVLSGEALRFLATDKDLKNNQVRPRIKSIAVVDKTVTRMKHGKLHTKNSRSFYITNIEDIEPDYVLDIRSKHWGIEMQHYILDVVLNEDRATKRTGFAMENGAVLRRFALSVFWNRPPELSHLNAYRYFERNKMCASEVFELLDSA